MSVESRLSTEAQNDANVVLDRLTATDRSNVNSILSIVEGLAGDFENDELQREAIFGVYVIGGYATKEGPRPDIDILIVGSDHWRRGYYNDVKVGFTEEKKRLPKRFLSETRGDHILGSLADHFGNNGFSVEIPEEVPDDYTDGADPKIFMRLSPQGNNDASPIDVVYVKGYYAQPPIETFENFYERDLSAKGHALGKVALWEAVVRHEAVIGNAADPLRQ